MLTPRPGRSTLFLTAFLAVLAFGLPASASALNIAVNSTGDAPDNSAGTGVCETATPNECTLRAAIQTSNASAGTPDRIEFSPAFDGQLADTITLGADLPDITDQVHIEGSGHERCETEDGGILGPCVGIDAAGHGGLTVKTHDVDIDGLAIVGAAHGVSILEGGDAATLFNTWIGLNLKGEGSHVDVGVEIAPGVEGVGIGAVEAFRRNLITNAGVGVRVDEAPFTEVVDNTIVAESAGVEVLGVGATINGNFIEDAIHGIRTVGTTATGSLIDGNTIEESGEAAIELQSPDNLVLGNEIVKTGAAGIQIDPTGPFELSGNQIGGDSDESENIISGALGRAIEIVGLESSENEVARNHGSGNGAEFIGLTPISPGDPGPNGAIKPPVIGEALQSTATGTALPGARIRVFRKSTDEEGELESFLGDDVAQGSGKWEVKYPAQLPVGTRVAVTQTNADGGTSEFGFAVSAADKLVCAVTAASGGSCGGGGPGNPIPGVPDTKLAKKPKLKGGPTAKFKFTSSIAGSSFECKLDKKKFAKCRSPKTYKKLKPGKHVFKVRAVSPAGVADPTPAQKKFQVKE